MRQLCESRLQEAQALLEKNLWTGAYYLTGLAVECALKSCLASAVKEHDFPDKSFVNQMYVHNLEQLFKLNGALWVQFQADAKPGSKLTNNWSSVKDWDNERRYDVVEELDARALYDAVTEADSGVVEWIRRRW